MRRLILVSFSSFIVGSVIMAMLTVNLCPTRSQPSEETKKTDVVTPQDRNTASTVHPTSPGMNPALKSGKELWKELKSLDEEARRKKLQTLDKEALGEVLQAIDSELIQMLDTNTKTMEEVKRMTQELQRLSDRYGRSQ